MATIDDRLGGSDIDVRGVRHALRADLDALEVTLARAFADDPMMAWAFSSLPPQGQEVARRRFMRFALDRGLPAGHTYSAGANTAAAVWAPPDVDFFDDATVASFFEMMGELIGDDAERVGGALSQLTEVHPHEPHFYLFVLGTDSTTQNRGLGSRVIGEVLDRCDRQGLPAYLESSNIRNVPFYERHGFRVQHEVDLGGCIARTMWREPGGG